MGKIIETPKDSKSSDDIEMIEEEEPAGDSVRDEEPDDVVEDAESVENREY